ncbi:MAG: sugar-transfer associated ATP-grasp domain-containing protein [Candidatus Andersenbacteria bacterium]|nr:sugar-transfer associated ATP-grasp domain-containing protein [bacterium]MDZ4225647.1 sugar-transfer associated ATP-grasp domain-containing protein [Candidatus Andersenbacteria bacterium]
MVSLFNKSHSDVLGLNARTIHYIRRANSRAATRLANNKLATKRALQKAGIGTPRLFAKISSRPTLRHFRWTKLPSSFVLKPNASSGGGGIVVIFGRNKKGNWVKADRAEVFIPELRNHILDILDGNFSANNIPDVAFFEQRIKIHHILKPYSVRGIPDIRVLIYNQIPVMAMLRLPTEESSGKANLHAGGIGVGIDLVHGYTTTAIHHGHLIEMLPQKRIKLSGLQLPEWDNILLTAVGAARACNLNYVGVDIAIDRDDGPLVLEINARPGLDIQFANMATLKNRLHRVEGLKVTQPARGVQLAKNLFGDDITHEIEDISGRLVLGVEEPVEIIDTAGQPHPLLAKIDTGAYRTTIDAAFAKKYNLHEPVIAAKTVRAAIGQQSRPIVELSFVLRGRLIKTKAYIADRSHMNYDAIIGRRDLKGFLVDPAKTSRDNTVIK